MAGVTSMNPQPYSNPDRNPPSNAVWIIATVIVGLIALGAIGWDSMLQKQNKELGKRVKDVELRLAELTAREKAAEARAVAAAAPPAAARRRRPPATATGPTTVPVAPAQPR